MTNPVRITAPEGVPFIDIVREFDAPVDALFRAHAEPELVRQWLGPNGYEMDIEQWEFATGGRYRYVHKDGKGGEYAFNGVFHVVRENDFAIQTFEFEGFPDVVAIESLTFTDLGDGRTRIEAVSCYDSTETRDLVLSSGMDHGVREGYERLDELLAG